MDQTTPHMHCQPAAEHQSHCYTTTLHHLLTVWLRSAWQTANNTTNYITTRNVGQIQGYCQPKVVHPCVIYTVAWASSMFQFKMLHFLLSAQCISSTGQIIKSLCTCVSQSVSLSHKRLECSTGRNFPPIFTKLDIGVGSQEMWLPIVFGENSEYPCLPKRKWN